MEISSNPTQVEIKKAAIALKDGHLVAFPTETVYGLGADATNEKAVSRIYSVKARPIDHPLIVHISSIDQLGNWAIDIPMYAIKLAEKFWPGPMTLILKRSELAKDFITGGQESVGVRVPSHQLAFALLSEFEKLGGLGVAAPSANKFGAVSPTRSFHVRDELGDRLVHRDVIIDGGPSIIGIESTIIDCTSAIPKVLRPGVITCQLIENCTGISMPDINHKSQIRVPGCSLSHYSPKAKVILNVLANPGEGFIALSQVQTPKGAVRLGSPKSIEHFARELYSSLRQGDAMGVKIIKVIVPEQNGIAEAILDRLSKM